ncbi:MAG: TIGR00341 family protein [Patescibacteria group bacterium]
MSIAIFHNLTEKDKSEAVQHLISASSPRQDFFLMVILSMLMATFGLFLNSSAVIIGSMLIAPILSPILSLALGIVMADGKLISLSFFTLLKSIILGVAAAALVALFLGQSGLTEEIMARTAPSLPYLAIAVVAGLAVSFALVKPQLNETLPGVAISVALIPPLAVTGIGIARLDWHIISSSLIFFVVNAAGIIFSSIIVFSLMNFYVKRKVASEAVAKEEKEIQKEKTL